MACTVHVAKGSIRMDIDDAMRSQRHVTWLPGEVERALNVGAIITVSEIQSADEGTAENFITNRSQTSFPGRLKIAALL